MQEYITLAIIIPVILTIGRALLKDEITYWSTLIFCYFNRPFDVDQNPDTHDWCLLYNAGDGTWAYVSLTFHFSLFKGKNGVFVHRYNDTWKLKSVERVSFVNWKKTNRKAKLSKTNIPQTLSEKLKIKHPPTPYQQQLHPWQVASNN